MVARAHGTDIGGATVGVVTVRVDRARGGLAYARTIAVPIVAAVRAGDVVMIKGSLGSRMEPLVEALVRKAETGPVAR